MFDIHRVELDWGGRKLILETGKIARQADGAVFATYGETTVLATVVAAKTPSEGVDFLPLTVDYQEKYLRRRPHSRRLFQARRPSDRKGNAGLPPDRPPDPSAVRRRLALRDAGDRHHAVARPGKRSRHSSAMVAASAALTLSGAPFMGPIGAARVGFINNEYVLNPQLDEMAESQLDLVVAGTADAVLMVESEAKELSEDIMLGAVMFGHRHFQPVIEAIIQLAEKAAKEPRELTVGRQCGARKGNARPGREGAARRLRDPRQAGAPQGGRRRRRKRCMAHYFPDGVENPKYDKLRVAGVFKELEAKIVRWNILDTGKRIDGRDLKTVRPIVCEVGVLPRTHGSALFTRGETQALVVTTLGTGEDEQFDRRAAGNLQGDVPAALQLPALLGRRNRPPRRAQAARNRSRQARLACDPSGAADEARIPLHDPRRLRDHRVERLVLDGHGLRHLAGADGCGRSAQAADRRHRHGPDPRGQALRRALRHSRRRRSSRRHGLQGRRHRAAASPRCRWTSRSPASPKRSCRSRSAQAKDGRLHILGEMAKALTAARAELGEHAPRIEMFKIPTDKIREVIGTGGKVIREIVEKTGAKINIEDDGSVKVASANGESIKAAINWIKSIASDPEVGHDLRGHRRQGDGLRRLRELLRRQGRPRAYQPARAAPRATRSPTSSRKATR